MEPYLLVTLCAALFVMALLYASVGHGGASGYLAVMALCSLSPEFMRPTALLLNVSVASAAFLFFQKGNYFKWRLFYPFAITSVPAAYFGGFIEADPTVYKQILGVFLLLAIARMLNLFGQPTIEKRAPNMAISLLIGSAIGLLSGMIGIGGGIILSPIIVLLGWGGLKESAAVTALFILVNSIAGLSGFVYSGGDISMYSFLLIPVALIGGILGAYLGSRPYTRLPLRYILSFVLLIASVKLFLVQ